MLKLGEWNYEFLYTRSQSKLIGGSVFEAGILRMKGRSGRVCKADIIIIILLIITIQVLFAEW
jgi:hypothetical protein